MPPDTTAEGLRAAQAKEWGAYVAVVSIDLDGARAFNVGDPVPASHVERGVVTTDQVKGTGTKAAAAAVAAATPTPEKG